MPIASMSIIRSPRSAITGAGLHSNGRKLGFIVTHTGPLRLWRYGEDTKGPAYKHRSPPIMRAISMRAISATVPGALTGGEVGGRRDLCPGAAEKRPTSQREDGRWSIHDAHVS